MGLTAAIHIVGGVARLAASVGVTSQHVVNWRARGVPADRVLGIVRATGGAVRPFDLRPDIYPDPDWMPVLDPPPSPSGSPETEAAA